MAFELKTKRALAQTQQEEKIVSSDTLNQIERITEMVNGISETNSETNSEKNDAKNDEANETDIHHDENTKDNIIKIDNVKLTLKQFESDGKADYLVTLINQKMVSLVLNGNELILVSNEPHAIKISEQSATPVSPITPITTTEAPITPATPTVKPVEQFNPQTPPIAFSGEMMLLNWSESSSRGRTVTFQIDEELPEHPFKPFTVKDGKRAGQRFQSAMVQLDSDDTPLEQKSTEKSATELNGRPYGKNVRVLHKTGWFLKKEVIDAVGSPDQFRMWLTNKPCAVCGKEHHNQFVGLTEGYAVLPVCDDHLDTEYTAMTNIQVKLMREWMSQSIGAKLGYKSLGFIPPDVFMEWAKRNNIEKTISHYYLEPND